MRLHMLVALFCLLSTSIFANESFTMVALGDSITTAYNATGIGNNRELSWSTGSDGRVQSHALRFAKALQTNVHATNVAKAGAKTTDLAGQWGKVQDQSLDYATLLIGANDLCSWHSDEDIKNNLEDLRDNVALIVEDMVARNPKIVINLLPLPNLYNVERLGHDRIGCQAVWNFIPLCDKLLGSSRTEAERRAVQDLVERANDQYEILAQQHANLKFHRALTSEDFTRDDISTIDCFHPSLQGQQRIAEESFKAVFPNGDEDVRRLKHPLVKK